MMNNMENLSEIPWTAQNELIAELAKVGNLASLSPKEREIYDENLRQYRDNLALLEAAHLDGIAVGREQGEKIGREEGEKIGRSAIARNMLSMGLSNEMIAQYTGMSVAEIASIQ